MSMTGSNLRPLLLLVLVPVLALSPVPQDLSERQAAFYSQYKVMVDTQDLKGINKLASKQRGLAEECIFQLCFRFAQTGEPKVFEEIAPLATAVDEVDGGKRFTKLLEY